MLCYIQKHKIYEYNTRRKCDFYVLSCKTSLFKRGAINMRIRLYKMPTEVKKLESFRDFQQKLKLFSLAHPFYSVNGFFLYLKKTIK